MDKETYMDHALIHAQAAGMRGEVPVGAILVDASSGAVIAAAGNRVEEAGDPTAHAEMVVIQEGAKRFGRPRLEACDLYVTLEPCPMCAAAISMARIRRLYFGAYDPKSGGVDHGPRVFQQSTCHHKPEVVGGLDETRCADILQAFFRELR
ncbi:MAG: nucleoside deaminase [Rhodospirillales bacterium]|nr:nucleoside deaminase [Rhodospirillales bacterium]